MSMKVTIEEIPAEIARRGTGAFLVTVGDDGRPKVTHVVAEVDDGTIRAAVGGGTAANAKARPAVTLLWPSIEAHQLHLLVDGAAAVDSDGVVVIAPSGAVQHRIAE